MSSKSLHRGRAIFSVSLVSGIALLLAAQGALRAASAFPCFKTEEIRVVWPESMARPVERYRLRPPQSIFQLNLGAIGRSLEGRYPNAELDSIRRVLPNRLEATFKPRQVIAQVKGDRYYPVNDQGIIAAAGQIGPWPDAPVFFPEAWRGSGRVGQKIGGPSFVAVAQILKAASRAKGIGGHSVASIRSRGTDLSVLLDSGQEIRFSRDDLQVQWTRLLELLSQKREIVEQARYIDLRFEDPVIGAEPLSGKKR